MTIDFLGGLIILSVFGVGIAFSGVKLYKSLSIMHLAVGEMEYEGAIQLTKTQKLVYVYLLFFLLSVILLFFIRVSRLPVLKQPGVSVKQEEDMAFFKKGRNEEVKNSDSPCSEWQYKYNNIARVFFSDSTFLRHYVTLEEGQAVKDAITVEARRNPDFHLFNMISIKVQKIYADSAVFIIDDSVLRSTHALTCRGGETNSYFNELYTVHIDVIKININKRTVSFSPQVVGRYRRL